MPYNYRKMSPEERAAIVEQRRQRGYPMHAPPHPYREAGWYLITAANYEHKPIMQQPERRESFERELLTLFESIKAEICGWVILPNHYHILAGVNTLDIVSTLLKNLHGRMSREWNLADQMVGKRRV